MMARENIFIFSVMSFIIQMMISLMIAVAQAGTTMQDPSTAQAITGEMTNEFRQGLESENINTTEVEQMRGSHSETDSIDPVGSAVNLHLFIGRLQSVILNFGLNYVFLSFYVTGLGDLGWIAGSLIAAWQLTTIFFLLMFILPRLNSR